MRQIVSIIFAVIFLQEVSTAKDDDWVEYTPI